MQKDEDYPLDVNRQVYWVRCQTIGHSDNIARNISKLRVSADVDGAGVKMLQAPEGPLGRLPLIGLGASAFNGATGPAASGCQEPVLPKLTKNSSGKPPKPPNTNAGGTKKKSLLETLETLDESTIQTSAKKWKSQLEDKLEKYDDHLKKLKTIPEQQDLASLIDHMVADVKDAQGKVAEALHAGKSTVLDYRGLMETGNNNLKLLQQEVKTVVGILKNKGLIEKNKN